MKALFITDDYIIDMLGTAYLSSYLKAAGHEVGLIKTNDPEFRNIRKTDADMLCYSVTTGKHRRYLELNRSIREKMNGGCISVFGGPHVTFFPEMCEDEYVDVGVMGEGFDAIVDIADAVENDEEIAYIQNAIYDGIAGHIRPLKNKDRLLMPDRDLIYKYKKNYVNPIKNVMCSFGCIYDCAYCYWARYREMYETRGAQIRPVFSVMEEIARLKEYPLGLIFFQDDVFPIYHRDWLDEFVFYYRRVGVPFHIQVRAELVKDSTIKQLKEVGLHGVTFAIESGNRDIRYNVLGRRISNETIVRAALILEKYGIRLRTENMIGVPGETWDSAMQTVKLNSLCEPTIGWASLYQPYPGTELGDRCIADGTFDGDIDSMSESFFDTYRLKVPDAKKFERLQKLFSILVKHPKLRIFAYLLCSLPFSYKKIYSWYKKRLYRELYRIGEG